MHSKAFQMRPNSVGVPYAFRQIMARRNCALQGRFQCWRTATWMRTTYNMLRKYPQIACLSGTWPRFQKPSEGLSHHLKEICVATWRRYGRRRQSLLRWRCVHRNRPKTSTNPGFSCSGVEESAEENKIAEFGTEHDQNKPKKNA